MSAAYYWILNRMKKRAVTIACILSLVLLLCAVCQYSASAETFKDSFKRSLDEAAQGTGHAALSNQIGSDMPSTIGKIVKAVLGTLGVIFLGLIIYGGYIWFASRGNESEVSKAKQILRNAIIGFIIIAVAYGVTEFAGSTILKGLNSSK